MIYEILLLVLSLFSLVCIFICLYWCTGTVILKPDFYSRQVWRANHRILTNIIGVGGLLGSCLVIAIGTFKLIGVLSFLPWPAIESFLSYLPGVSLETDRELPLWESVRFFCSFVFGFIVTFTLWNILDEFIGIKTNQDREKNIQHRLKRLRRHYLYVPYEWTKEEYEADDDEDTSVDIETHIAFLKGELVDEAEREKIERSHAAMEEIDKRNEAEWEEIKRAATDKVKAEIDESKKKINFAKKNGFLMVKEDELEALHRLLDEVSDEDKETKST